MPDHGPTPCTLPRRWRTRTGTVVACSRCHALYAADWASSMDGSFRSWSRIDPPPREKPQAPRPDATEPRGLRALLAAILRALTS